MNRRSIKNFNYLMVFPILILIFLFQNCSKVESKSPSDKVTKLTDDIVVLGQSYQVTEGAEQKKIEGELFNIASERRNRQLELIELDTKSFFANVLSEEDKKGLPENIIEMLEQKVQLQGELEVYFEDYENGDHKLRHFLKTNDKKIEVHYAENKPMLKHGTKVDVKGTLVSGDDQSTGVLAINSFDSDLEVLHCCDSSTSTQAMSASVPNTFGEQRVLVILVNYQNKQASGPTVEEARQIVFDQASNFYLENSFNETWLTGEVKGWYTIPMDSPEFGSTCKTTLIGDLARAEAENDGVDLSVYNRFVYVFPRASCTPSGSGTVGGSPSHAWVEDAWFSLGVVGHEIGHNFGLYHSGSKDCGTSILGEDCMLSPYSDWYDMMGNYNSGHFNGYHKERLGWLDAAKGDIAVAATTGTYTIETYESSRQGNPKIIKILKEVDPITGDKTWYYIEQRQGIGFDSFLANNTNAQNGVIIREAVESGNNLANTSFLLDATPNSIYMDVSDSALEVGKTFVDDVSGIEVTTLSVANGQAVVSVTLGSPTCIPSTATLTVSAKSTSSVSAGGSLEFNVTVKNNNSSVCPTSSFNLSSEILPGFSTSFNPVSLSLASGASATSSMTIYSSSSLLPGDYVVKVNATADGITAQAEAIINITQPNQSPNAVNDTIELASKNIDTIIDVLANDSDPDGQAINIVSITQGSKGNVSINSDGTLTYSPAKSFKSSDSFTYTISDGELTNTATVFVSLTSTDGDKGGGSNSGGGKGNGGKK